MIYKSNINNMIVFTMNIFKHFYFILGWFQDRPVAVKTLFDSRVDEKLKKEYMDELLIMIKVQHVSF